MARRTERAEIGPIPKYDRVAVMRPDMIDLEREAHRSALATGVRLLGQHLAPQSQPSRRVVPPADEMIGADAMLSTVPTVHELITARRGAIPERPECHSGNNPIR